MPVLATEMNRIVVWEARSSRDAGLVVAHVDFPIILDRGLRRVIHPVGK